MCAKYYGDTENRQVLLKEVSGKLHLEGKFGIYWVENVRKDISRPVEHHGQDHGDVRGGNMIKERSTVWSCLS